MRASTLLGAILLNQYAVLISARPGSSPIFPLRSPICANSQSVRAGSGVQLIATSIAKSDMNDRRSISKSSSDDHTPATDGFSLPSFLVPRRPTDSIIWCARGSRTYIVITLVQAIPGTTIKKLLDTAYFDVVKTIADHGDGLINGGIFQYLGENARSLRANNADGHQLTYGVLGAAIEAVHGFMSDSKYYFGAASFKIFDGLNQVGEGVIG